MQEAATTSHSPLTFSCGLTTPTTLANARAPNSESTTQSRFAAAFMRCIVSQWHCVLAAPLRRHGALLPLTAHRNAEEERRRLFLGTRQARLSANQTR